MSKTPARRQRRPYAARMPLEERREQLMDAALCVIVRDGYAGVSVASIAREAGVTRPVLYGAFEGLSDLLFALMERMRERVLATVLGTIESAVDLLGDVDAFVDLTIRKLVDAVITDPDTWRPILASPPGTPQEVWAAIEETREEIRTRLAELLGAIIERLPLSLDPDVTARILVVSAEHHGRLLVVDPEQVDVDALVRWHQTMVAALATHSRALADGIDIGHQPLGR